MSPTADADADAEAAASAIARLAGRAPPALSTDLWRLLADSHAHPQLADYGTGDDEDAREENPAAALSAAAAKETARQTLARASASRVACMSVAAGVDWARVEALADMDGDKKRIIPCFGIHPWWAHLHGCRDDGAAEDGGAAAAAAAADEEPMRALLEAPDESEMQAALQSVARAAAEGRLGIYGAREDEDEDQRGGRAPPTNLPPVAPLPRRVWEPRLRSLLEKYPHAIVGEAGLDRAAVIPGTKRARCSPNHQLALLKTQLSLAASFRRPISLHCVRAHGALYEELRARALVTAASVKKEGDGYDLSADCLPPAVMLHSFGGAPEEAVRFSALEKLSSPSGRGRQSSPPPCRIYFSFSAVINAQRTDPLKLAARIRAVPEDRLLLESDEVTPPALDGALARSLALVAAAQGWGIEEAARRCRANFDAFYSF
jgi:TatD DNase family protein